MMRIVGILLLGIAACEVLGRVLHAERRRCAQAEGVYALLLRLRSDICERALPLADIYTSFENEALAHSGFLSLLREKGLSEALRVQGAFLPDETRQELIFYAQDLGKRFREEERVAADKAVCAAEACVRRFRSELPRRLKVKRTVFLTGTGMVLLFFL